MSRSGKRIVLVDGLPNNVTDKMIRDFVCEPINVNKNGQFEIKIESTSSGVKSARIIFESHDAAVRFIQQQHKKPMAGTDLLLDCTFYKAYKNTAVLVKGLPVNLLSQDICDYFESESPGLAKNKPNVKILRREGGRITAEVFYATNAGAKQCVQKIDSTFYKYRVDHPLQVSMSVMAKAPDDGPEGDSQAGAKKHTDGNARNSQKARSLSVYVTNLPPTANVPDIYEFFNGYVKGIAKGNNRLPIITLNRPNNSEVTAKIQFDTNQKARECVEKMDKQLFRGIEGRQLKVEIFNDNKKSQQSAQPVSVQIASLPRWINEKTLYQYLKIRVDGIFMDESLRPRVEILKRGGGKAIAKVTFTSGSLADKCIATMNGHLFQGNKEFTLNLHLLTERNHMVPEGSSVDTAKITETPRNAPPCVTGSNTVYVSRLPQTAKVPDIYAFFHSFVKGIDKYNSGVPKITLHKPNTTWRLELEAKIQFDTEQAAINCVEQMDKKLFEGREIRVEMFTDDKKLEHASIPVGVQIAQLPSCITPYYLYGYLKKWVSGMLVDEKRKPAVVILRKGTEKAVAKVMFISSSMADQCIASMNGHLFEENERFQLKLSRYTERNSNNAENTAKIVEELPKMIVKNVVLVEGFPKSVTEDAIIEMFEVVGKVRRVNLFKNDVEMLTGRGTVSFENSAAAERCIHLFNGTRFHGNRREMLIKIFETSTIKRRANGAERRGRVQGDTLFGIDPKSITNLSKHEKLEKDKRKEPVPRHVEAYDCIVCFDTWPQPEMIGCVPINQTDVDMETHYICRDCAQRHAEALTTDGEVGTGGAGLPCGTGKCKRVIMLGEIKKSLDDNTIRLLEKRMATVALLGIDGLEYCKSCDYGAIIEANTVQMQYFHCANEQCKAAFCRTCKIDLIPHTGKSCEDADPLQIDKRRKKLEEDLSAVVIRICPSCKTQFQKLDGCNKMICGTCQITMCYLCRETRITYDHFKEDGCPLFENADDFDEKRIQEIQTEAGNLELADRANYNARDIRAHAEEMQLRGLYHEDFDWQAYMSDDQLDDDDFFY